jgi:peptide/nickel transport system permease protein
MTEAIVSVAETDDEPLVRKRFSWLIGACVGFLGIVVVLVIAGQWLAPQDPAAQDLSGSLAGPSGAHWLGTDTLGRDVFSRLLVGTRSAVLGALVIAVVSMVLGNILGLIAGYRGGLADSLLMRWVDLMVAVPSLLVIIVVGSVLGGGYWLAVAMLTILTVPFDARIMRAVTLEQVPRPYVEAAKAMGVSDRRIMLRHIWPNISNTAVANSVLIFAGSLIGLSGLSFLGLGAPPGTPDWGQMLAESQALMFSNPIAAIAPGVAIVLTATSVNLFGDWIYEKLSSRGINR